MKATGIVLLTAAQLCCVALMPKPAAAASISAAWSDLWHTPDQQGQALLDAGQAAQAADHFQDPRRRAYADLQAGRYQDAAKLLAPFNDPESEYNRGNALAKSGQLQAAVAAYDAALKQSPADRDIRRNRDLVERALRQKQQSPQSSRSGQRGRQGAASSGQQPQSGANGQQAGGGNQTASSGSRTGTNPAGSSSGQDSGQNGNPQQSGSPQAAGAYGSGTSKEAPGQAQRDAALATDLARKQQQRGASGNTAQAAAAARNGKSEVAPQHGGKPPDTESLLAGGTKTPKQKPETERQLALDQWLRQIPDSPAGLLQRKFLIEHMMKQQDSGDSQDSGQ